MSGSARLYIVAYDIASPRRWRRVQKIVKRVCQRGQLSVFLCRATPARMARLEAELRSVLDNQKDRLMVIELGPAGSSADHINALNPLTEIARLKAAVL